MISRAFQQVRRSWTGLAAALWLAGCSSPSTPEVVHSESPWGVKMSVSSDWKPVAGLRPEDHVWKNGDATLTVRPWETKPGATLDRALNDLNPTGNLHQRLVQIIEWTDQGSEVNTVIMDADMVRSGDYDPDRVEQFEKRLASRLKVWQSDPKMQAEIMAFAMGMTDSYEQLVVGSGEMLLHNEPQRPRAFFNSSGVMHVIELEGAPSNSSQGTFLELIQGLTFQPPTGNQGG